MSADKKVVVSNTTGTANKPAANVAKTETKLGRKAVNTLVKGKYFRPDLSNAARRRVSLLKKSLKTPSAAKFGRNAKNVKA
jgi:hypothetical protein